MFGVSRMSCKVHRLAVAAFPRGGARGDVRSRMQRDGSARSATGRCRRRLRQPDGARGLLLADLSPKLPMHSS